jgi:hypothetical protein
VVLIASARADLGWILSYRSLGPDRCLPFPIPIPAGTSLLDSLETLVWARPPFFVLSTPLAVLGVEFWKCLAFSSRDARPPELQLALTLLLTVWLPYSLFRPRLVEIAPSAGSDSHIGSNSRYVRAVAPGIRTRYLVSLSKRNERERYSDDLPY